MKRTVFLVLLSLPLFVVLFAACEKDKDDEKDMLYVQFNNATESEYTITSIELRSRGKADESDQPAGDWGSNILAEGETIAPGSFKYFNLEIPNLHWSEYRLGVDDGNGNQVFLHQQQGYNGGDYPITHWGSDERTVQVTIQYNSGTSLIGVTGWSDFAGIDD